MTKRHYVLVVDDDESFCDLVRTTLELEGIEVSDARHVFEAEGLIRKRVPDAILLDVGLPGIDGLFYCQRLREDPSTRSLPIIVISGSAEAAARAKAAGATTYLRKPVDPLELLTLLERAMGVVPLGHMGAETVTPQGAELQRLIELGHRQHNVQDEAQRQTLVALTAALDSRDSGSSAHAERVNAVAVRLALEVEPALTDDPSLEWGFLLHDVGMVGIPSEILHKRGALTPPERKEMERHTVIGETLLSSVPLLQGEGLRVVRSHHERWDGAGYPDRLSHLDIPASARIFAAVDALDAMTEGRPYRSAIAWDAALTELCSHAGTQFDPDVIDGLLACEPDLRATRESRRMAPVDAAV